MSKTGSLQIGVGTGAASPTTVTSPQNPNEKMTSVVAMLVLFLLISALVGSGYADPLKNYLKISFNISEMFSTFVFAAGGAVTAKRYLRNSRGTSTAGLLLTCCFCGFATANFGGALIRDPIAQHVPFLVTQTVYIFVSFIAAIIAFYLEKNFGPKSDLLMDRIDYACLGVFAALGAAKAQLWFGVNQQFPEVISAILFGALTAAGGGMFRDWFILARTPTALKSAYLFVALICAIVSVTLSQLWGLGEITSGGTWLVTAIVGYFLGEITRHIVFQLVIRDTRQQQ